MILKFVTGNTEEVVDNVTFYRTTRNQGLDASHIEYMRNDAEPMFLRTIGDCCFVMNDFGKTIDTIQ